MRHEYSEKMAKTVASVLANKLEIPTNEQPRFGLVLGTGWGDALKLEGERSLPFGNLPGFEQLGTLTGHLRHVVYGKLDGTPVIALRGRVHLNEHPVPNLAFMGMVRLQIEMLLQLGVKRLILTCAAGSLADDVKVWFVNAD